MNSFDRLAPFIQDYIYKEHWDELREVQVAACDIILNTDSNLLLATGTASGKTEAAFLPTLTSLYDNPSSSVGILYVSPLKALINDQFYRLDYLLQEGDIPVCKWHGDASQSAKKRLLKNPQGVLQITPESLESLLINKRNDCVRIFRDLRFVIIDEVHYFMSSPRGIQLLCQLERIQRLIGIIPRRIGLSATLGNYEFAENWLNSGTNRKCKTPHIQTDKKKLGIATEYFVKNQDDTDDDLDTGDREHFEYLYKNTLNKKCIIFANSRAEIEFTIANIKALAAKKHTKDVYRVHHGNISAALREETEKEMKSSDEAIVTGATVTLELGIDIGTLDRVVQIGAPFSVSSFTQRLGRCGRRGQRTELIFTFIGEDNLSNDFSVMNWDFLKGIAILQLFLEEHWIEPIISPKYPYALLYHQTMSYMASQGETSPAALAQNILTLSAFKEIPQSDYKTLLRHLLALDHLQLTERGGIMIGCSGEKIINNYEFYSVFETVEEHTVKYENQTIGTLQNSVPIGEHFALAGRSWECVDVDEKTKTIFVKYIKGISKISWFNICDVSVHTRVMKKMRDILISDENYIYLSEKCNQKLQSMRNFAKQSGFAHDIVTALSKNKCAVFPWIGTKQMCALLFALKSQALSVQDRGYYLIVETNENVEFVNNCISELISNVPDKYSLNVPEDIRIPYKFNDYIPPELLKKEFIEDYLDLEGMKEDIDIYDMQ